MKIAYLLGCSPYIAGCLSATSYVTVVFYTRTFSNSLEAFFFAFILVFVCDYVNLCTPASKSSHKETNNSTPSSRSEQTSINNGANTSQVEKDAEVSDTAMSDNSQERTGEYIYFVHCDQLIGNTLVTPHRRVHW